MSRPPRGDRGVCSGKRAIARRPAVGIAIAGGRSLRGGDEAPAWLGFLHASTRPEPGDELTRAEGRSMRPSMSAKAIVIDGGGVPVSGLLRAPAQGTGTGVLLAHGAGADMRSDFMAAFADGLAERGHTTLRFNFPYKEAGKKAPDPRPRLEATVRAAADALRAQRGAGRLVIGGKSMGGRMASLVAAAGYACDGLVFLGYPLHAAGRRDLRDEHLARVSPPMLFVEGTRDPLCDLALLRPVLSRLGSRAALHVIDGGDHSLAVPKSAKRSIQSVYDEALAAIDTWLRALA
jgi:predicted alpha/beta-hydrolase family hydrolase